MTSQKNDLRPNAREALQKFSAAAQEKLGSNLTAVVAYSGSLALSEAAAHDPAPVLVVLEEVHLQALDGLRQVLDPSAGVEIVPWVLTRRDLKRSTDSFPVKIRQICQSHHLLYGDDVLSGLEPDREHLRLRCEQEVRNLVFRLRGLYIGRAHRGELLENTLHQAAIQLSRSLGTLLFLRGVEAPQGRRAVLTTAAENLDLDATVLLTALDAGSGGKPVKDLKKLYGDFMEAAEKVAVGVDRDDLQ